MTAVLRITHAGPVATVMMARPEVHNAFNETVIAELLAAFNDLAADESVRVVVLAGEGKSFSAGADLDWMRRMSQASEEENQADAAQLAAMLRTVADCPKPVVARVQGAAIGGGAGLVAAADIAIAAQSAHLAFAEVRLGIAPATIAPHVITRIGPGRALPLFLTGERITAAHAQAIGLVHRTVPDSDLDSAIDDVVQALLAGSPAAQAAIKHLVPRVSALLTAPIPGMGFTSEVDEYTSQLIASLRASPEGREGIAAFLEKRKAKWAER